MMVVRTTDTAVRHTTDSSTASTTILAYYCAPLHPPLSYGLTYRYSLDPSWEIGSRGCLNISLPLMCRKTKNKKTQKTIRFGCRKGYCHSSVLLFPRGVRSMAVHSNAARSFPSSAGTAALLTYIKDSRPSIQLWISILFLFLFLRSV